VSPSSSSLHVVCPHCDAINRVPETRLAEAPACGQCHRPLIAAEPFALTAANFDRHLGRSDLPLVVDFWAPWCGPCRTMAPAFAQVAAQMAPAVRFVKIDTESEPALAQRFGIRSIPTIAVFSGGREITRRAGAMDAGSLLRWVRQAL
jgi:thioredoxin 2